MTRGRTFRMQKLDGAALAGALETLARIESTLLAEPEWLGEDAVRRDFIIEAFHEVSKTLDGMQLQLSAARAQSAAAMLAGTEVPEGMLVQQEIGALRESVGEELAGETLIQLSPEAVDLLEAPAPTPFPGASFDLEEAAKCLVFERWTACVWHLSRVLTAIVDDLAPRQGIVPLRHWDGLIAEIAAASGVSDPASPWRVVSALLGDIRLFWASPTLDPAPRYGEVETRRLHEAVTVLVAQAEALKAAARPQVEAERAVA